MEQRYFRSESQTYELVRAHLDAAWGHPSDAAVTCIAPASAAPKDSAGRVYLAVLPEFCEYPAVAGLLPSLLAEGVVQEIDRQEYIAATTKLTPP